MKKHRTTSPGYKNRNDQVVLEKTQFVGTDRNQFVYVLECTRCGKRYGANGSDIWERKCPNCQGGNPGIETKK